MKVLHVIDSLEPAGAERSLVAVLPALRSLGIEGTVAHFGTGPGLAPLLEDQGFTVQRLTARGWGGRLRALGSVIDEQRPDLVHTSLFTADVVGRVAAWRAGVPVVSSVVTMQYSEDRRAAEGLSAWKVAAARTLDAGTAQLVTRFHAITTPAAEHARARLHVRRKPIEVIPRGRSGETLGRRTPERRQAVRERYGWDDGRNVLLAVARQEPAKALDVLLDAAAVLRTQGLGIRLVLVGRDGAATDLVRRRIDELDLHADVDLLGLHDEVADLMVGADVLVLPSRREGLGGVLLEAMALELPIVASDLPSIAEVAPSGDVSLLAPVGDAADLAAAIADVLGGQELARARAERGRSRFERLYEIDSVAVRMAAFYRGALANAGSRKVVKHDCAGAPVRVAHVVWRLSPTGGIPRVVRDLCVGVDPEKVEMCVVSVRPGYPEDRLDEVIDERRFRSAGLAVGSGRLAQLPAIVRLTRELRKLRPDVLHLHAGTSWLAVPAALSMPRTVRLLEMHDEPQSGRSRAANIAVMRLSARRLGFGVLVNSTVVRARTAEAFGIAESDIELMPLGVDVATYRPDDDARRRGRRRLGLEPEQPLVVWVGRLEPLKRPEDALAVARTVRASLPDAVFALAGPGSLEEDLAASVRDDASIRVLGEVDDLAELLNAADVLLSTSGYEGFGLSVAEAMACGLPVVSTRAGGVVDLVSEGRTGRLTSIGDVDALAAAVLDLLDDPIKRERMGGLARTDAETLFSREAMARLYEDLYVALSGDRHRRS